MEDTFGAEHYAVNKTKFYLHDENIIFFINKTYYRLSEMKRQFSSDCTEYPGRLLCLRLQNLLDAREGLPQKRYSTNYRFPPYDRGRRRRRRFCNRVQRCCAQGRLNFTSEMFLMYDTMARGFSRIFSPRSLLFPRFSYLHTCFTRKLSRRSSGKAGAKSRRDEIEPGESVP